MEKCAVKNDDFLCAWYTVLWLAHQLTIIDVDTAGAIVAVEATTVITNLSEQVRADVLYFPVIFFKFQNGIFCRQFGSEMLSRDELKVCYLRGGLEVLKATKHLTFVRLTLKLT